MRVRTRVRRFSVHVRKCTYVQNVLPRETQDAPPFHYKFTETPKLL